MMVDIFLPYLVISKSAINPQWITGSSLQAFLNLKGWNYRDGDTKHLPEQSSINYIFIKGRDV